MPQTIIEQGRRMTDHGGREGEHNGSDRSAALLDLESVPGENSALTRAARCAHICDQYRGQNTAVLDLTGITPLFDYFVITTATNRRQMHAIADEVNRAMKQQGSSRRGLEGYDGSTWVVEDYGDVVLHVFTPDSRRLYDLENLWADAERVDWQSHLEEQSR